MMVRRSIEPNHGRRSAMGYLGGGAIAALVPWAAWGAGGLADAPGALRVALEKGAAAAVSQLGRVDGFWGHPQLRIGLPGVLKDAEPVLRTLGQGNRLDDLLLAMNRGAENAVPQARGLLEKAVKGLSIQDAQGILSGGDTAVTRYFEEKTRDGLTTVFLPEVAKSTQALGVAQQYNQLAEKAATFGLIQTNDANIERYVTRHALDGLYFVIGEEERKIRRDPTAYGSAILSRVFGALR